MPEKIDDGGLAVFLNTGEEVNRDREIMQEKLDDPNRASILPFRKTKDGVKLAAPKWWLELQQAVTLPRDAAKGYQVTGRDAANFALNVGVGGITTSSATDTPSGAILGAFFRGQKTHKTPMYPSIEEGLGGKYHLKGNRVLSSFDGADFGDISQFRQGRDIEFRSPLFEAFDSLDFPEKGLTGRDITDSLSKLPNVRGDEVKSVMPKLDPKKRYTLDEAVEEFSKSGAFDTTRVGHTRSFESFQRQKVDDPELEYIELPINSGAKNFIANSQHYNDNTLAHSRLSLREDSVTKKPYVLVEEMQSDLIQKGWGGYDEERVTYDAFWNFQTKSQNEWKITQVVKDSFMPPDIPFDSKKSRVLSQIAFIKLYGDEFPKINFVFDLDAEDVASVLYGMDEVFSYKDGKKFLEDFVEKNIDLWAPAKEVSDRVISEAKNVKAPPITSNTEAVRLNLQAAIAYAQLKGADEVVIPPLKDIVDVREFMNPAVAEEMLKPGSAFHNTYVRSVDKVLKKMKQELGDKIQVREKPYSQNKNYYNFEANPSGSYDEIINYLKSVGFPEDLMGRSPGEIAGSYLHLAMDFPEDIDAPVLSMLEKVLKVSQRGPEGTATVIDISGMKDLDLARPRFNRGGLVTRRMKT